MWAIEIRNVCPAPGRDGCSGFFFADSPKKSDSDATFRSIMSLSYGPNLAGPGECYAPMVIERDAVAPDSVH